MRLVAVLVLGLIFLVSAWRPAHLVPNPWGARSISAAALSGYPTLLRAGKLYERRGQRYIWGTNDCSVFVTDYLKTLGTPLKHRLTTACLAGDVAKHGLRPVRAPRPGDVLNYRYRSRRTHGMAGHCGVVIKGRDGAYQVVHNSSSGGLVMQPLAGFYRTAEMLGASRVRVLRRA